MRPGISWLLRRAARWAVFLIALCLPLASAHAAPPPWGDLAGWEGRYPTDMDAKPRRDLFVLPALQPTLQRLLAPQDRARLKAYAVQKTISRIDGLLVAQECMPHDCDAHTAMVVIDTSQPRLWVGFYERGPGAFSTRWYGTADSREIPPAIMAAFEAQHTP